MIQISLINNPQVKLLDQGFLGNDILGEIPDELKSTGKFLHGVPYMRLELANGGALGTFIKTAFGMHGERRVGSCNIQEHPVVRLLDYLDINNLNSNYIRIILAFSASSMTMLKSSRWINI
jgi:hypothetical protein